MNSHDHIIILGAGGHSKVILSTLLALGKKVAGFVDDNPALIGLNILGHKVLGPMSSLTNSPGQPAIAGIGDNQLRKKLTLMYPNLCWITAIHPTAYVHESVRLGEGTIIFAGAVIQPDTNIGKHVIINTSTSIDHDCHILDFVHIAPGSHLAGGITIEEGSLIGIGTSIIPNITVGQWSTMGAGSVVVNKIAPKTNVKGVPAKIYNKEKVF